MEIESFVMQLFEFTCGNFDIYTSATVYSHHKQSKYTKAWKRSTNDRQ